MPSRMSAHLSNPKKLASEGFRFCDVTPHSNLPDMKYSYLLLAAVLLCFGIAGCSHLTHQTAAAPPVPPVERPPYDPALTYKMVTFYQGRVRRNPQNGAIEWGQLANAYLQRCRETGDIADAQRAEKAAQRSIAIRSINNAPGWDALERSLFVQHQFVKAEALAHITSAKYQDDPVALMGYADAALERGDYATTERALKHPLVAGEGKIDPSVQAVQARMLDIKDESALALQLLLKAQAAADANLDTPRENVAWFHMRVGDELARLGHVDDAQKSYLEALELYPHDYKTMTGLARLAAGRQDWAGTIAWGQKAAQIVPTPEVVALIGDAYAATGKSKEAEQQYRLIEAMGTISRAQSMVYDRYRAMFDANHNRHLDEALALAKREMLIRQDIYAYDTLAWAEYKNGMLPRAAAAMKQALAFHTQDSLLFYHAGTIAKAQGDKVQSAADFTRASALDPYFKPSAPDVTQHPYGGF